MAKPTRDTSRPKPEAPRRVFRYTRAAPCPICGGSRGKPRRGVRRCAGAWGQDGRTASCSQAAYAGHLLPDGETYRHRIRGRCPCGGDHDHAAALLGPAVARDPLAAVAAPPPTALGDEAFTDVGNGQRLVRLFGRDLRYVAVGKRWFLWDDIRWREAAAPEMELAAKAVARSIAAEACARSDSSRLMARARQDQLRWADSSENVKKLQAMLTAARSEPGVALAPDQLDRGPWLLNCPNGTVDLRTGALLPHWRGDYCTRLCGVPYDPTARAPRWEAFLSEVMGQRPQMVAFLLRVLGYAITGSTREHVLFVLWGPHGRNGKSTLTETLAAVLGDYAVNVEPRTLTVRTNDRALSNDVARLAGPRYAFSSEPEGGKALDEAFIKQITGEDTVTARPMYRELFSFRPQVKIFLACNALPHVNGTDNAIWSRLVVIPFEVTFQGREDRSLRDTLAREGAGILASIVRGAQEWRERGLAVPEEVLEAQRSRRRAVDPLQAFLDARCVVAPSARVVHKRLYEGYAAWAQARDARNALSLRDLGTVLRARGFEGRNSAPTGALEWHGLGLAELGTHDEARQDGDDEGAPEEDGAPEAEHAEGAGADSPESDQEEAA